MRDAVIEEGFGLCAKIRQGAAMFQDVTLPLWLLILIVGFAAVTFASHFLFPSVRWFFRKRAERALAQLNTRLDRPIELFKLARRQTMRPKPVCQGPWPLKRPAYTPAKSCPPFRPRFILVWPPVWRGGSAGGFIGCESAR
jgi:hypothetical protein